MQKDKFLIEVMIENCRERLDWLCKMLKGTDRTDINKQCIALLQTCFLKQFGKLFCSITDYVHPREKHFVKCQFVLYYDVWREQI